MKIGNTRMTTTKSNGHTIIDKYWVAAHKKLHNIISQQLFDLSVLRPMLDMSNDRCKKPKKTNSKWQTLETTNPRI